MAVPASPLARYRASSLTLDDTDPVTAWADESGNGRDLSVVDSPPVFDADGFLGGACVVFDGTTGRNLVSGTFANTGQPVTSVVIGQLDEEPSVSRHFTNSGDGGGSSQCVLFAQGANDQWAAFAGSGPIGGGGPLDTDPHLLIAVFNGGSSLLLVDGTQVASGNTGSNGYDRVAVGGRSNGSDALVGRIAEVITYDRALDAQELEDLHDYYTETYLSPDVTASATVTATASITAAAQVDGAPSEPQIVEVRARVGMRRSDVAPPGEPVVFVEDWSTYPDSTFGNSTGLDGRRVWRQGEGLTVGPDKAGWCIVDGQAVVGSGANGVNASLPALDFRSRWSARLDDDLGSDDCYARMTVGELSGTVNDFGPMVRVSDGDGAFSAYWLQMRPGNGNIRISPIVDGSFAGAVGAVAHTHTPGDVYEIRAHGSTISGWINGTQVTSVTDTQVPSGRRAGMHSSTGSSQTVRVDLFQAAPLDDGVPVDGAPYPAVPAVQFARCGVPTATEAPFSAYTRNVDQIRLVVSESDQLTSPIYTSAYTQPDGLDLVRFTATGLTAATTYHWGLQVDGQLITPVGAFRTAPSAAASFSFCVSGDSGGRSSRGPYIRSLQTANTPGYDLVVARDPEFFLFLGDQHYRDPTNEIPTEHLRHHRDVYDNPRAKNAFHALAVGHMWDDHDFTGDSADASATGRDVAVDVFRRANPVLDGQYLVDSDPLDPVGYTFTWGRARFIITDHRSAQDRTSSPRSHLGPAQQAAVVNLIETATEPVIFLHVGTPWISSGGSSADDWGAFTEDRAEIAEAIEAHAKGRVIIMHTDAHMIAADDGTNSQYADSEDPGPPVWCHAPIGSGTSHKGGPYTEGMIPAVADSEPIYIQYAEIDVDDQGSQIVVTWHAWSDTEDELGETEVMTQQYTVPVGGD